MCISDFEAAITLTIFFTVISYTFGYWVGKT